MGASPAPDGVMELSEGLSLVPCTVVSLAFVRADVSVKPVDEWQLKGGLVAMFKKRLGLTVADRDLVVQREKNYFKKRRDEPIANGTLHLWGSIPEGAAAIARHEGADFGKYFLENVNGVELSIGGLKLKCLAVIKETNDFEVLKRSWEAVFGPRRGGTYTFRDFVQFSFQCSL
jgi:arginine/serine-rich splicing factor 17